LPAKFRLVANEFNGVFGGHYGYVLTFEMTTTASTPQLSINFWCSSN